MTWLVVLASHLKGVIEGDLRGCQQRVESGQTWASVERFRQLCETNSAAFGAKALNSSTSPALSVFFDSR